MMEVLHGAVSTNTSKEFASVSSGLLDSVDNSIGALVDDVGGLIDSITSSIDNEFGDLFSAVSESVTDIVDETVRYSSDLYDQVGAYFGSQVTEITDLIDSAMVSASNSIHDGMDILRGVGDEIEKYVEKTSVEGVNMLQSGMAYVSKVGGDVLDFVGDGIDEQLRIVGDSVNSLITPAVEFIDGFFSRTDMVFGDLLDDGLRYFESIIDVGEVFTEALLADGSEILTTIVGGLLPALGKFGIVFEAWLDKTTSLPDVGVYESWTELAETWITELKNPEINILSIVNKLAGDGDNASFIGKMIAGALMTTVTAFTVIPSFMALGSAKSTQIIYDLLSEFPITAFSVPEAVGLAIKGLMSSTEASDNNLKHGYTTEQTIDMITASALKSTVDMLMQLWRRGEMSEDTFEDRLTGLGYNTESVNEIKVLKDALPTPSDLISMSVREAFSEDHIREFETDSDLPPEFVSEMSKQGFTEEWARKYWIAHWRIPSANQGFEMLHRKIIDDKQLDMMLTALDITPFWRDKLKGIAYRPINRVDIRRMFKLGVIDADEVLARYEALGYTKEDSEVMQRFTIVHAGTEEESDLAAIQKTSLSQIQRLWSIGTIGDDEASALLRDTGISETLSKLMPESWGDEAEYRIREQLIDSIVSRAVKDNLSNFDIRSISVSSGLNQGETDRIENLVDMTRATKTRTPTKAEIVKMTREGILSFTEYSERLSSMGFSEYWIDKYAQLYEIGKYEASEK